MDRFWYFARRMLRHRRLLALAMVFAVISAGGMGAGVLGMAPILQNIIGSEEKRLGLRDLAYQVAGKVEPYNIHISSQWIDGLSNKPFDAVMVVIISLGILTMIGATANFLHAYLSLTVVARTIANIRRDAFRRAVKLPMRTILERGPSDTISRIVYDTTTLASGFTSLISKAIAQITKGATMLIVAFVLDWRLASISILVGFVLAIIIRKLSKRIRRASRSALSAQGKLYQSASEVLSGLRVVKAFSAERIETGRFHRINKDVVRQELRARTARALASPLVETIALFVLGAMSLVAIKAILEGHLDPKGFFMVLGSLVIAASQLRPLVGLITDIQQAGAAADRLHELLILPTEPGHGHRLPRLPRHTQSLTFDHVTFSYPGADRPALNDVTLVIPHGQVIAFVGPNGCGKTTLLSLLPRFIDPDNADGHVLVDGKDIRNFSVRSVRGQIGVVTQDTVLFEGTIRSNIAYGDGVQTASDEQVAAAARRARAEDFILDKPTRYNSPIGENGVGLSGGQRQRLTIARALLRDPAILILDEATSMIDADSEAKIADAIAEFVGKRPVSHTPGTPNGVVTPKRTCLIVAHRLSTVKNADRIVVMDLGRIVDQGTHEELLGRCEIYGLIARNQLVSAT
ncbi:MAG: ABC transporter ATP-binding protein [Pyrinomonadaceae bacterium]|nr:ABC transporter ATP-binding protein [Phycisphaerales bacterium]